MVLTTQNAYNNVLHCETVKDAKASCTKIVQSESSNYKCDLIYVRATKGPTMAAAIPVKTAVLSAGLSFPAAVSCTP